MRAEIKALRARYKAEQPRPHYQEGDIVEMLDGRIIRSHGRLRPTAVGRVISVNEVEGGGDWIYEVEGLEGHWNAGQPVKGEVTTLSEDEMRPYMT